MAAASCVLSVQMFQERVATSGILIAVKLLLARRAHLSGFVLCWLRATLLQTCRRVGASGSSGCLSLIFVAAVLCFLL